MERGTIPINKNFELEYRYYDRDTNYKYFNRRFEIYVLEKKTIRKNYVLHMDNADKRQMMPGLYKASTGKKRHDFGITTLNWNDIRNTFLDYIVDEIGSKNKEKAKKAINKLNSPKI